MAVSKGNVRMYPGFYVDLYLMITCFQYPGNGGSLYQSKYTYKIYSPHYICAAIISTQTFTVVPGSLGFATALGMIDPLKKI